VKKGSFELILFYVQDTIYQDGVKISPALSSRYTSTRELLGQSETALTDKYHPQDYEEEDPDFIWDMNEGESRDLDSGLVSDNFLYQESIKCSCLIHT